MLGDEVTYEKYHISIRLSSSRKEIIKMFSPPTPTTDSGDKNDEEKK